MMWQDCIFAIGGILFSVALIPSIIKPDKPHYLTSLLTASILSVFACTYLSLHLTMGSISTGLTAFMWWILFAQQLWRIRKCGKQS